MSELIKHSFSQQLMYPDELAYSLNLISTPQGISQETKNRLIILSTLLAITAGISFVSYYYQNKKNRTTEFYQDRIIR